MSAVSVCDDMHVYKGKIIDQMITTTEHGDLRVILSVKHTAKLKDDQNLAAGSEPCPPKECEVWLNFSTDGDTQLRIALSSLERLGFSGDDVSRLHPDHPDTIRLI